MKKEISKIYDELKKSASKDITSDTNTKNLIELMGVCKNYILLNFGKKDLYTNIIGKEYFVYEDNGGRRSRPVNKFLFDINIDPSDFIEYCSEIKMPTDIKLTTKYIYTFVMMYCIVNDIIKKDDKKTPGTVFEFVIGHICAKLLGVTPQRTVKIPTLERDKHPN